MSIFRSFLPQLTYGGMDGIITTFAIITGVAGAGLSAGIVVILGFASVFADAFSMAVSSYVSHRSGCSLNGDKCDQGTACKMACATFISFLIAGSLPLIPFALSVNFYIGNALVYSVIIAFTLFFIIGYAEGKIVKGNALYLGVQTLLIGILAAGIAYSIGAYLSTLITI